MVRKVFDSKINKDVVTIGQGECVVTNAGEIMSSSLGSCVSVCLIDLSNNVGGMNHYMLPEPFIDDKDEVFSQNKYGISSMDSLVEQCLSLGAKIDRISAKIFGGAKMLIKPENSSEILDVGSQNIKFAKEYLSEKEIVIIGQDVLSNYARKIYFNTLTGDVTLYKISTNGTVGRPQQF